ncbi:Ferric reductase transmembrane component 1 [Leucoagaricus sp. SymC.cos]|nr:Ferric reductase transmembrane component 1 [Leucoagaricus sp. SymC.cos]
MADTGTPPVVPLEFQQYDSYAEAPEWQLKFSMVWVAAVGISILFFLPHLILARRDCRKDWSGRVLNRVGALVLWTIPGLELNLGQIIVIVGYLLTVILCMTLQAPLTENSNRAGFIALAQLPVVFLFATKNSIVSLLLGPGNGYEKLNFVHRWAGRGIFIAALVHGSFWINNHLTWGFPIIGQQKETSGVAALGLLCVIAITSARPVRKAFYEFFYVVHTLAYVAFFVTVCYHTIYAPPWIYPPLAFYGLDMLLRFFRYRIKDATLTPIGNQFTVINIPFCTDGWVAGQHVRLRVFFEGRIFESHPLTIFTAPPSISCLTSVYIPGITLGVRSTGDWSCALNAVALNAGHLQMEPEQEEKKLGDNDSTEYCLTSPQTQIQVMIDGPYGGCGLDLGRYETVLLFAGGAGVTFTLGMLDDIVGRCVRLGRRNGERTRRIEFAWCIKSFGLLDWFASALIEIARTAASSERSSTPLSLHISVYVTCLCNPEAVPPIPNCDVTIMRPDVHHILNDLVTPPNSLASPPAALCHEKSTTEQEDIDVESSDGLDPRASRKLPWLGSGGAVAVCASGPASLMREAANAVARLRLSQRGMEMGGVDIHTEVFSL